MWTFIRPLFFSLFVAAVGGGVFVSEGRDIPFAPRQIIDESGFVRGSLATVDLNGDGMQDVMASGNYAAWYQNVMTNGTVWKTNFVGTMYSGFSRAIPEDIDLDGDLDCFVSWINGLAWAENVVGATLWITNRIDTNLQTLAFSADLDRDGDGDVVTYGDKLGLRWYENSTVWTTNQITTNPTLQTVAADINRDGALDVVGVAGTNHFALAWYDNVAGDASAWALQVVYTNVGGWMTDIGQVTAADLDADGDVDLVANDGGSRIWFRNEDGNGSSWQRFVIRASNAAAVSLKAGDLDQDGDLDLLTVISGLERSVEWNENLEGTGLAWSRHVLETGIVSVLDAHMADLDVDGDLDVLVSRTEATNLFWYKNNTIHHSAAFTPGSDVQKFAYGALSLATADIDRDGTPDVVTASFDDDTVAWNANLAGDGSSWARHVVSSRATGVVVVAVADVDNDGDSDILAASDRTDSVLCFRNTAGDGSSWSMTLVSTNANGPRCLFPADVDQDGLMDVAVASYMDDTLAWYENKSLGTTWTRHLVYTHADGARAVSVADVDRDGDQDFVYASYLDDTVAWLRNDAGVWSWHEILTNANGACALVTQDVDRDGHLDVVSASYLDGCARFHQNVIGLGLTWSHNLLATNLLGLQSIAMIDLDQDGDADMPFAATLDDDLGWLKNPNREGGRTVTNLIAGDEDGVLCVVPADIDRDGDPDLVTANVNEDRFRLFRNQGGSFGLITTNAAPAQLAPGSNVMVFGITAHHRGQLNDSPVRLTAFEFKIEEKAGDPLLPVEASNLLTGITCYHDRTTNGVLDGDDFLGSGRPFSQTNGVFKFLLPTNAWSRLDWNKPKNYFILAGVTTDSRYRRPHQFRLTHLTESCSTAVDGTSSNIPVDLEYVANCFTPIIEAVALDTDGDGLPDDWESAHLDAGLNPAVSNAASADFDSDRISDFDEYIANTDPNNPQDYLHIQSISNVGFQVLFYESAEKRYYQFDCATNLLPQPVWSCFESNVLGHGGLNGVTHTNPAAAAWYRIRAELP